MKKDRKTETRTAELVRFYDSDIAMRFDGDQFLRHSHVFPAKSPPARDFRVKVEVKKVNYVKGTPPIVRHRMLVSVEVTGAPADVDRWLSEASRTGAMARELTASEQLRKFHRENAGVGKKA